MTCSKVFLGHKKGKPEQLYAIKAMKKVDMINKNLKDQGEITLFVDNPKSVNTIKGFVSAHFPS